MKSPRSVTIAITGKCNLACKHCFYADEMRKYDDLPTDRWLAFIKECGDAAVMYITLTGGEPFMRPDIFEIIDAIVKNRMRFSILTNGTLVTEDIAKRIADTGRVRRVQVSVDGDEASHEWVRGKGTYKKALDAVKFLSEAGIYVAVSMNLPKYMSTNVRDAVARVTELGTRSVGLYYPHGVGEAKKNINEFDCVTCFPKSGKFEELNEFPKIVSNVNNNEKDPRWKIPLAPNQSCGAGVSSLYVHNNGVFTPCAMLRDTDEVKVLNQTLDSYWSNSPFVIALRSGKLGTADLCPVLIQRQVHQEDS